MQGRCRYQLFTISVINETGQYLVITVIWSNLISPLYQVWWYYNCRLRCDKVHMYCMCNWLNCMLDDGMTQNCNHTEWKYYHTGCWIGLVVVNWYVPDSCCITGEYRYRPILRVLIQIICKRLQSADYGRRQHKWRICVLILAPCRQLGHGPQSTEVIRSSFVYLY